MKTVLLTGVTGAVGSSLAPLLKREGYRLVYLARPSGNISAKERVEKSLGSFWDNGDVVLSGDIVLPCCGVNISDLKSLIGKVDKVVHCAASIRFEEDDSKEVSRTNVLGTKNVLDLTNTIQSPEIHYMSTAYVAGDAKIFHETDFDIGQRARNIYEKTKLEAERLVRNWSEGRFSIYRMGILVGDSRTGSMSQTGFSGYYAFYVQYYKLANKIRNSEEWRKKCCKGEIKFNSLGQLVLPIYIDYFSDSTLNIVPCDWLADLFSRLLSMPACGETYHLTHPRPGLFSEVTNFSLGYLGVVGWKQGKAGWWSDCKNYFKPIGRIQRIADSKIRIYVPYMQGEACFTNDNVVNRLGNKYWNPPELDNNFFKRMLDFAIKVNFGRGMTK